MENNIRLELRRGGRVPLYRQIVDQLRSQIEQGDLAAGSKLPPVRDLAARHGQTRLTVHAAYVELQALGLVRSHVGRGTFVAGADALAYQDIDPPSAWRGSGPLASLVQTSERRELISLAQAYPAPETFPVDELRRCMERAVGETGALGYGSIQGDAGLREEMARLMAIRGVDIPPEHLLITSGAQQGMDVALRALTTPQDVVLVEEPTYPGILQIAAARGQRVIGVPSDDRGIRVDLLEYAIRTYRPRLLYLVPTFSNPTGVALKADRREAVVRLAQAHDLFVVEDDIYGLLAHEGTAPLALKSEDPGDRVIYLTSLSKALAPALRLGVIAASPDLLPAMADAKQGADLVCSTVLQRALAAFLRRGLLDPHLVQARARYALSRDRMLAALQRELPEATWSRPAGGLSLWLKFPAGIQERDLLEEAKRGGMTFAPGSLFFSGRQRGTSARLSFGMQSPERIDTGIGLLAEAARSCQQRQPQRRGMSLAAPLV